MGFILVNALSPSHAYYYTTTLHKYTYAPAIKVVDTTTQQPLAIIDGASGTYSNPNIQIDGLKYVPNNYKMNIQQSMEYQIFDLINQKRVESGLSALEMDANLQKLARFKSADMVQNNYYAHEDPDDKRVTDWLRGLNMSFSSWAENIIKASGNSHTAEDYVNSWWNSEDHRNNLLNPNVKYTGIGVVYDESHGIMYLTQDFIV